MLIQAEGDTALVFDTHAELGTVIADNRYRAQDNMASEQPVGREPFIATQRDHK